MQDCIISSVAWGLVLRSGTAFSKGRLVSCKEEKGKGWQRVFTSPPLALRWVPTHLSTGELDEFLAQRS